MVDSKLFRDLLRYGEIKADFDNTDLDLDAEYIRVRVFEHGNKKYFAVMCDGEFIELKEL